ncbi:acetyl-CoA synthetase-like protein [Amylostereum chailletii]|nr:acetyl-CoA synthetase-like protein [Amylostereum chailletii]
MIFKSPYAPLPDLPNVNYYDAIFGRPEVAQWPDYTVYIDGITGEKWGFKKYRQRIDDAAAALAGPLGIKKENGEVVGVLSENCMDYPTIVMSLLKIAVPVVLFPAFSTSSETTALIKLSEITRLFVSPRLLPIALSAAKEVGLPENKIYILRGRAGRRVTFSSLVDRAKSNNLKVDSHPVQTDTLAYLVFSSGTSGLPKGVMLSHRNLCYSALQPAMMLMEIENVAPQPSPKTPEGIPVTIAFSPMYHAMGLHLFITRLPLSPATCIVLPKWEVNKVLDIIPKYKVSTVQFVPAQVLQLLNSPRFAKADLSSIEGAGAGAAYLPVEFRDRLVQRLKLPWFLEGYGMSECTVSAIAATFPGSFGGKLEYVSGMTGVLLAGMEARIVREDGTDADFGEPGELHLRGGNVGLGYWKNEKATRETFLPGGWLCTGDRFKADEAGRFFYVDRTKDTLKISGVQVSPSEIESTLVEHPGGLITDAAVAGVAGTRMSDEKVPKAWIVLSAKGRKMGKKAVVKELDAWVKEKLSSPKWIRGGYEILREIPKSPTGKVLRRVLQESGRERSIGVQTKL